MERFLFHCQDRQHIIIGLSVRKVGVHCNHGYVWRRPIVTAMVPVTCQPFHTVRTPSSEWQVGNRACQPLVLCGFVWQSSCPWHVRFAYCFCWWCIIISWILILQWTQLRQRCRTDVVHTIGFVQMYLSRPCTTCFLAPIPSQQQTLSQQDDSHSRLDVETGSNSIVALTLISTACTSTN